MKTRHVDQREVIVLAAERGARVVHTPENLHKFLDWAVEALRLKLPTYTWTGVYLLRGDELVLQCYRGKPTAHARIPVGRGICGAAVAANAAIVVPDVSADPRYLARSVETRSEIVVPIRAGSAVVGEIDVDSDMPSAFTIEDQTFLERLAEHLGQAVENAGALPPEPDQA